MKKAGFRLSVSDRLLCSALLVACASSENVTSQTEDPTLQVLSRASWNTPLGPELHVLIRNPGVVDVDFSISFVGRSEESWPDGRCQARSTAQDRIVQGRFRGHYAGISTGRVPTHGWAHRSIAMGPLASIPCWAPYWLCTGPGWERCETGIMSVREPPRVPDEWSPENLSWEFESMVESNGSTDSKIARVLVSNHSDQPLDVWVTDRDIVCPKGNRVIWSLMDGPPHRAGIGPISLEASGWGVLLMEVSSVEGTEEGCMAWIQLAVAEPAGNPIAFERHEIDLNPTGFFAPFFVH